MCNYIDTLGMLLLLYILTKSININVIIEYKPKTLWYDE